MELRHLRYFVGVATMENVSRAALALHVSQPALSAQIRDLEDEIGLQLFERTAKSIRLTKAGRAFLDEARAVLHLSIIFSKVKQKPRIVEEYDSMAGILSSVEAGTGVAIGMDVFGYSFGNRVKVLGLIPKPKPTSIGIVAPKGKLSPAAEKFWQCAKEAASKKKESSSAARRRKDNN